MIIGGYISIILHENIYCGDSLELTDLLFLKLVNMQKCSSTDFSGQNLRQITHRVCGDWNWV